MVVIIKEVTLKDAAAMILEADNIGILIHQFPDGDAIGSGYALQKGLTSLGKKARVICDHIIPEKYIDIIGVTDEKSFEPEVFISVDLATKDLLGENLAELADNVLINIDHHYSNTHFAEYNFVDSSAAAAAEIAYELLLLMKVPVSKEIANCIYIGISTDTGCFRYSNVTPKTHKIAAQMIEYGANFFLINKEMFDTKSKARIEMERLALTQMEYYFNDKCALMLISLDMIAKTKAKEEDLEGLTPIPRQIKGVLAGITLREKQDGTYKISIRSDPRIDARAVCSRLNGGGHKCAAGCTVNGPLENAKKAITDALSNYIL